MIMSVHQLEGSQVLGLPFSKRVTTLLQRFQNVYKECFSGLGMSNKIFHRNHCIGKRIEVSLMVIMFASMSLIGSAQTIHRTACLGNLSRLDSMLAYTPIEVQDNRGRSLLHWAVACRKREIFDFLVERGIDTGAEDNQKKTPMHIAIQYGSVDYFDFLLDLQSNHNWANEYGGSLLEQAVLNRDKTFLVKLLDSGIDINAINDRGSTALEISMRIGSDDVSEFLLSAGANQDAVRTIEVKGRYMGQVEPGLTPRMFAPNFISTEQHEFGSVFNADATEFYYGLDINGRSEIRYSKLEGEHWSHPVPILTYADFGYNDPFLSPDENRLYFISRKVLDGLGEKGDHDIWYLEKTEDGWSEPINAGSNINSDGHEYYISFTKNGTMYFSSNVNAPESRKRSDLDIYYSKYIDGSYQEAINLGDSINTDNYEADVFIDPTENYMIFCAIRPGGLGRGDLYISFKNAEGKWTKSINMGAPINTKNHELCPFVTADRKYLFYTSNEDIYWVSTEIIKKMKETTLKK